MEDALLTYFNEFAELKLFMTVTYDNETETLPLYERLYLDIEAPLQKIPEIYVRLLNFQVPTDIEMNLRKVAGSIQHIKGNDHIMSEKVNMDYFSVRINELPPFAKGDINILYKRIRDEFLILSKGEKSFQSHTEPLHTNVTGRWEFQPYKKDDDPQYQDKQLYKWKNEIGGTVIFIEAGGGWKENIVGDSGAVLESESIKSEMCWIFTTIVTKKSDTQPFSGHRQFGIHKDEEGNYRFFARAIDRIWPSNTILNASLRRKDFATKDYLTIADATWNNLIKKVSDYIVDHNGKTEIMTPTFVRTDFNKFLTKFKTSPTNHIGNIPQYKEIQEDEI